MGLNNCIVTNLFAAFEVLYFRQAESCTQEFLTFCDTIRMALARYAIMYANDYHPWGQTEKIVEEITRLMEKPSII